LNKGQAEGTRIPNLRKAFDRYGQPISTSTNKPKNMRKELGNTISLDEIKQLVRQKISSEFSARLEQVNLQDNDVQNHLDNVGHISLPPLLNKKEMFTALWNMDTSNNSLKWDFIVLLTYLNDGEVFYQKLEDDWYLVTIKF
jgi:hypothetical protein